METTANILVVDDDAAVRGFLRDLLGEDGYHVVAADNARMALEQLTYQTFDVALIDLKMNGDGGLNVLSRLHEHAPDTTAIVLTGYGSLETAVEAMRYGAHDYLLKPCKPEDLRASVRSGVDACRTRARQRAGAKFVADISHELRNPLTTISLGVKLLEHSSPERRAHYLDNLKHAAAQLEKLVDSTLILSRLDNGHTGADYTTEDLRTPVGEVVSVQHSRAEVCELQLHYESPAVPLPVRMIRSQFIQVIANLLTNAINYTPAGGRITARVYAAPGARGEPGACFEVQDTGVGIAAEDLPYLCTRFYRGRNVASLEVPGNGLGLAIAKEIITLHGGALTIESQVGEGSTFRVWLPLAPEVVT